MEIKMFSQPLTINGTEIQPFELFKDYFKHYCAENKITEKKYSYDSTKSFEEKDKSMNKVLLEMAENYIGSKKPDYIGFDVWAQDNLVKQRTFAIVSAMIDSVLPETLIDGIGLYSDIRVGAYGDSFAFDVKPRELFTVSQAGHGKRTAFIQKQFNTTKTLLPINHEVSVAVSLYKVLAGKESLAAFTAKVVRAIESQVTYEVYDAMNAALTSGNMPSALKLTAYTQDSAIKLAQTVTAWNGGNKAVFVGTVNALSKIVPANANYRYMLDSKYVTIGHVQEFGGFDLMSLPQVADYTSTTFGLKLNDNTVYVISPSADKIVKLGLEGSTLSYVDKINENANLLQTATFNKSWDAQVVTSAIAGSITVA